ncbi:MAG: OmpA family protein [Candidatus Zixiibacteriota bacterium]|nr:MAG: OmpA family protein [candidate division Zixibacteria bacterium]
MADASDQPIIVRKKRRGHGGHHSGAWKVAFADFMTAMMAFFLVMWLVGQKDEVKQAVAGYFRDPGKYNTEGKSGVLKGSNNIIEAEGPSSGILDDKDKKGAGPSEKEKNQLTLVAKTILQELSRHEAFERLRKNVKIELTSEGLRIVLNESENSAAFFEPGSSKLLQKSAIILITIARELGQLENRLVIEGHTDAAYGGDQIYTNWELSADRANSARSLMEVSGLWEGQVREVRGFADEFPMIQNDPYDHRNRRVTIVVLYESRNSNYDQIEVGADLMGELGG